MIEVKASTGQEHYKTIISTNNNSLIADEPLDEGGQDLGFTPKELLAASLASCTSITLRMYADRKEWKVDNISVSVTLEIDRETNTSSFKRTVAITGDLDEQQRNRMLTIANACPVHKILSGSITIHTELAS